MEGLIYLEDGLVFKGEGFGAETTKTGELVFNTSMVGYQGILTDPASTGQIINMTYPLIGNYGINEIENESEKVAAYGLIVKNLCEIPSNEKSIKALDTWLEENSVPGVSGLDTRMLMRNIRDNGTMKCVISTEGISFDEARRICENTKLCEDLMKTAGTEKPYVAGSGEKKLAVLDMGMKKSTLDALCAKGLEVHVFPYSASCDEILECRPDGVFLSEGPGDPNEAEEAIEQVARLAYEVPLFGTGLGHQLIALAFGGRVFRLKAGHRGANHGVFDKETGRSYITVQNHGFSVSGDSIMLKGLESTHINLNDGTVEGMRHRDLPVMSVQFAPEYSDAEKDSGYIFDRFIKIMGEGSAK